MHIVPASTLLDIAQNYADHRSRREASWYWYNDEGGTHGALPSAVSTLYRGQNARHTPMLPSIARDLQTKDVVKIHESPLADQAKIIFRTAQSWWFARELMRHPISQHATNQKLDLNEIALAQHYGIPTGYLDLSDDFAVSAFFATCRETKNGWEPVDAGIGVIYRVHLLELKDPFHTYLPLGPQPLPRPSEQCAWVTELPICHAFEGWPCVEMLSFHHDPRVGEHFLEMYDGGKLLFPPDPLADVTAEILACREIPIDLVEAVLALRASDPYGILPERLPALRREISKLANQISYRELLTDKHVSTLLLDQEWIERMMRKVTARAVLVQRLYVCPESGNVIDRTLD